MAFWGDYFQYDGRSCTEFGLRLYEVNGIAAGAGSFSLPSDISEDRIAGRYKSLFYGVTQNEPLKFKLVFGVDTDMAKDDVYFDSWDKEAISAWLSPHDGYKWLEIEQDDMEQLRYLCRFVSLSSIELGNVPIAFSADVSCDSPFAYMYPRIYSYKCTGTTKFIFRNLSSYRGGYKPKMTIILEGGNSIQIINHSNGKRFELSNLPQSSNMTIEADNENGILSSSNGLDVYPYFNFEFFELAFGDNQLEVVGNCTLEFCCEFPVSVGG